MSAIAGSHQHEITQLKQAIEQVRQSSKRPKFPSEIRQRVSRLRKAGVSNDELRSALQLSKSSLCRWEAESAGGSGKVAPRVLAVDPAVPERRPSLTFSCGPFTITVETT